MNNEYKRIGILGLSEGNGHPYSWSAIFNGYDQNLMSSCGFPLIPEYLSMQKFPEDLINGAKVTHIWTQSIELSKKIAKTCFISNIVKEYQDMIGEVDAILLARDDAINHYEMAKPFLEMGLPIYIDKPIALTIKDAKRTLNLRKNDYQIFTCSALKYAKEFNLTKNQLSRVGNIICIKGVISNSWDKYAIHLIEPILNIYPKTGKLISYKNFSTSKVSNLNLSFENINNISITTINSAMIKPRISILGDSGIMELEFKDTFFAFKAALKDFLNSIISKKKILDEKKLFQIIKIIELGNNS